MCMIQPLFSRFNYNALCFVASQLQFLHECLHARDISFACTCAYIIDKQSTQATQVRGCICCLSSHTTNFPRTVPECHGQIPSSPRYKFLPSLPPFLLSAYFSHSPSSRMDRLLTDVTLDLIRKVPGRIFSQSIHRRPHEVLNTRVEDMEEISIVSRMAAVGNAM
jgi:hypothetical protein